MSSKQFNHFMTFWQQLTKVKTEKPVTASNRRVSAAKASLKAALAR